MFRLAAFRISLILSTLGCFTQAGLLQDAQKDLFAARYKQAAALYSQALAEGTNDANAYYGLVRALIEDHRSHQAYRAAEDGLAKDTRTPGVQTAAGLAAYRRGDLPSAEDHYRQALQLDKDYAGALYGLASINNMLSRFQTARGFVLSAYRSSPTDPLLMLARANTLKGAEHIAALQEALALLDPESDDARRLSAHIADDVAAGGRKLRRLVSPYERSTVKLSTIFSGPSTPRGAFIRVQLNGRHNLRLMLDTGASGISIAPKSAESAGLNLLGEKSREAKGIGDRPAQSSYSYIAPEIRIGDVVFADYPVSAFRAAKSSDTDGFIGADVFKPFLVTIDFPKMEMSLEPRSTGPGAEDQPVDAISPPPAGFHRAFRFGNHLTLPTQINSGKPSLFLIDSGAAANLLDTEIGSLSTGVHRDDRTRVGGVQGTVNQTSRTDRVSLFFAGFRQDSAGLIAISLEKTSDDIGIALGGILGWPVLSHLSLTIDYQQGLVHFEHRK